MLLCIREDGEIGRETLLEFVFDRHAHLADAREELDPGEEKPSCGSGNTTQDTASEEVKTQARGDEHDESSNFSEHGRSGGAQSITKNDDGDNGIDFLHGKVARMSDGGEDRENGG